MIELLDDELPSVAELNALCASSNLHEDVRGYGPDASTHSGYRGLRVWKLSMEYAAQCYRLSRVIPKDELYGLTSQLRRAACSIGLNIAEGWGRNGQLELARSCDIARGSLCETNAALELAVQLEYLTRSEIAELEQQGDLISSMLRSLAKKARSQAP